jgi:hypothetical protein
MRTSRDKVVTSYAGDDDRQTTLSGHDHLPYHQFYNNEDQCF